jgi:16S rRNA processing protein RimM
LTSSTESDGGGAEGRGAEGRDADGPGADGPGADGRGAVGRGEAGGRGQVDPALIVAGRVGRPHGLDGCFHVTGARPRLLSQGMSVEVGGRTLRVRKRGGTDQRPLLWLTDVEDREAALALRGEDLRVAAQHAPSLGEGEWWAHELEGCEVHDDAQTMIGVVSKLIELPSCEALEVVREQGEPLLVPMVKDAIKSVDAQRRRIEVDLRFLGGLE